MSRKILISGLSIIATLGIVGAATFAYFSDVASSTGNTFSSGTLNLQLDDVNETTPGESVSLSLSATDFQPGASTSGFISLHNGGTISIAEVEMAIDTSETADPGANSDLRDVLQLTVIVDDTTPDSTCTDGTDVTTTIDALVGNGGSPLTLKEFDDGGVDVYDAFLTGTGLIPTATRNVCFTVTFDSTAGDIYQGDAVSTDFTFTGNQDATQ